MTSEERDGNQVAVATRYTFRPSDGISSFAYYDKRGAGESLLSRRSAKAIL